MPKHMIIRKSDTKIVNLIELETGTEFNVDAGTFDLVEGDNPIGWTWNGSTATAPPPEVVTPDTVYSITKARGDITGVSFDDVENVLSWVVDAGISSTDVDVVASEITINATGIYKFTVTLRTNNGNRTELFIRTYFDTGSGYVQDTNSIVSDYVSRDTDQDTGAVTLVDAFSLNAGEKVQFRGFGDTDGACVGLNAGTVLLAERVA